MEEIYAAPIDSADLAATAERIATSVRWRSGADFVLVQLYDDRDDAFHDKDRSIVLYNGLLTKEGFRQRNQTIGGDLKRKQNQAALLALDLLRRYLQNLD